MKAKREIGVKNVRKFVAGCAICSQGQLSPSKHIRHAPNPVNKHKLRHCFPHCYCTFKSLPLFQNTCSRCGLQSHLWLGMMQKRIVTSGCKIIRSNNAVHIQTPALSTSHIFRFSLSLMEPYICAFKLCFTKVMLAHMGVFYC